MRSLIALVVCASAALHKEGNYSSQWLKVAAPFAAPVRFTISVKQQNMDLLKQTALDISTPDSPTYGQFMTDAEIDAMTAPTAADMNSVTTWLEKAGISHTVERSNVHCTTNVATASTMFATKFYKVSPELQIPGILADKHFLIRAGTFTIPDNIQSSISTIFGLHGLPLPKRTPLIPSAATDIVTPAVIEQDYGIKDVKVSRKTTFRQAVAEFQGQYMNATDLSTFFREFVPSARAGDDKVFKYVGASKHDGAGVEALLDIQYIMGVAPGVKTEFWEYPGQDFCLDLNTYTTDMITGDDKPVVHSISYGWQGDLSDLHCTQTNIDVVDGNFAKAAAKGISVMISSGDSGSGYSPQNCGPSGEEKGIAITGRLIGELPNFSKDQCCSGAYKTHATGWTWTNANQGTCKLYQKVTAHGKSSDPSAVSGGSAIAPPGKVVLFPSWPASSPWVTSVGATRFVGHSIGNPEMASDQFGSGGGFSKRFPQSPNAKWQSAAVANYLKTVDQSTLPPAKSFPATGRATPDVSALGEGYQVYVRGKVNSVGGTSASAPAFAGMVSLLNEARLAAGKRQMGFLNPWLYANPDAFTSVLLGSNKVDRGGQPLQYGFNCSKGWDPVTGLGTPLFPNMLAAAMKK